MFRAFHPEVQYDATFYEVENGPVVFYMPHLDAEHCFT